MRRSPIQPRKGAKELFFIINNMIDAAVDEVDEEISCRRGCDYCCHLLVEISTLEASALAQWIQKRPKAQREEYIKKIKTRARDMRSLLKTKKNGQKFIDPKGGEGDIPDWVYDKYFYDKSRPCVFLKNGECQAYESRPSSCRLHMVSSDPELCRADVEDDSDYEVPERIEELKEDVAPVLTALEPESCWGPMPIMVEKALAGLEV